MAFDDTAEFPIDVQYGGSYGPGYSTSVIEADSGHTHRIARWPNARRRFNARYAVRSYDKLYTLLEHYHGRDGIVRGFPVKDFTDFTTASNGRDAPANNDVVLGTGDSSNKDFQLIKKYVSGGRTVNRTLTKIVAGSVKVAIQGVDQPTGWSVDTTTGILSFTVAPGLGFSVTAGCEFRVPVQYGAELDDVLSIDYETFATGGVRGDIPLVEMVGDVTTPSDFYYGHGTKQAIDARTFLNFGMGRTIALNPSAAYDLELPAKTNLETGGPYFFLINLSGTHALPVKDAGSTVFTLAANGNATVCMYLDGGAKTWVGFG